MNNLNKTKEELFKELEELQQKHNSLKDSYKKDIAERDRTLDLLRKDREKYRFLFEGSNDGIILVDDKLRILDANTAYTRITGTPKEDVIGKSAINLAKKHLNIKQLPKVLSILKEAILKTPVNTFELLINDKIIEISPENFNREQRVGILRDVTEIKKAENNLREREEEYRAIFEGVNDGIIRVDKTLEILNINSAFVGITGLAKESVLGKSVFDLARKLVNLKQLPQILKYINNIITNKPVKPYKLNFQDKILEISAKRQNNGEIIGVIRDITWCKRVDQALKESEKRYKTMYLDAPLPYQSLDKNGVFIDVNNVWLNILGYEKAEVIGKHFGDFMPFESAELVKTRLPKFKKEGRISNAEFEMVKKNGSIINVKFDGKVGFDENGNFKQTHCIFEDITERKNAEEALKDSENLLRATEKLTKVGGWRLDVEKQDMYWTDEAYRIHEIDPTEIKPGSAKHIEQSLNCYDEKDRSIIQDAFNKCAGLGISYDMEFPFTTVKGNRIWIRTTARAEMENNKVVGVVGNIMNITERKVAEKELKKSEERYKGIAKNNSACIAVYRPVNEGADFVFVEFNPMAEKVDNIPKEKVIGKKVTEVFSGVVEFGLLNVFQEVWKTGKPQHFPVSVYKDKRIHGYRENYVYKLSSGEIVAVYNDLTDNKRAGEKLASSELKFRLLADNTNDWEYWIEPDGKYIFISKSCEEITGYSANDFYNNHKLLYTLVHPEYVEMVKIHYESEEEKESPHGEIEFLIINRNGDKKWIEHNCTPVFDEFGNFMGRRGNNRDITERKRLEENLKKSEERFRTVVQDQTEVICRFDSNNIIVFANEVYCDFFGKSMDELIGHKWFPVAHADDIEIIQDKLKTLSISNPVVVIENRVYSGKGELHWFQFINRGVYNQKGDLIEIQSVGRNITGRKKAEVELRESEEKFRILYNNSPDMYVSISPDDASILYCNETFMKETGYSENEIIGQPIFKMYHEDCLEDVKKNVFAKFVKTGVVVDKEVIIKRKDGSKIIASLNVNPVKDEEGNILYSISSWRDNTERKRAEEKIASFQKDLINLNKHIEDLREKERKQIARDLHDDLGQKLTALNIDIAWVKNKLPKSNYQILEKIESIGELINETSKSIRDIASEIRPSILDNLGLIAAIKWQAKRFKKSSGINCRLVLSPEETEIGPELSINIFRIIQEALTNIIRHSQASEVIIRMLKKDKTLELKIIDNGIGIDKESISKSGSFGLLGMSERAKVCNGEFNISKKEGGGTVLSLILPFTETKKEND